MRAGLAALGIFIGTSTVIWLVAMGEGVSYRAQQQILELGAKNVIVRTKEPNTASERRRGQQSCQNVRPAEKRLSADRREHSQYSPRRSPCASCDFELRLGRSDGGRQAGRLYVEDYLQLNQLADRSWTMDDRRATAAEKGDCAWPDDTDQAVVPLREPDRKARSGSAANSIR